MAVKIKGMDKPYYCACCPLLIINSYGERECFVTGKVKNLGYLCDIPADNCPIEEVEE